MPSTTYDRRSGTSSRGFIYENKMSALIAMRLYNNFEEFHVASNMEEGGQFDDIVFSAKKGQSWTTHFVQLKHKENKKRIPLEKLYRQKIEKARKKKPQKNNFCITMYFQSYIAMQKKFKKPGDVIFRHSLSSARFYLFTNGLLDRNVLKLEHPQEHIGLLSTNASSEVNFKLCRKRDTNLIQQLKKEGADSVEQFVDQFYICTSQVNEGHVDKLVDEEIKKTKELTTNEVNVLRLKLYEFIDHKNKRRLHITNKSINAFLTETNLHARSDKKSGDIIKFTQSFLNGLVKCLPDKGHITLFNSLTDRTSTCLAALRQVLDQPYLTIALDYLDDEDQFNKLMSILEEKEHLTIIIELENDTICSKQDLILKRLDSLSKKSSQNRIIIVAAKNNNVAAVLAEKLNANTHLFQCRSENLAEETIDRLLNCTFQFQGYETSLNTLLKNSNSEKIDNILEMDIIEGFLIGEPIDVGIKPQKPLSIYVPRALSKKTVSPQIFSNPPLGNTFVVSGITLDRAKHIPFFENIEIGTSSKIVLNEDGNPTEEVGLYILEGSDHQVEFKKLLSPNSNLHWLQCHKRNTNIWYWRQSIGNIELILKNLTETFEYFETDNLMSKETKVVVVSAESGMGKTTLLNNIASQMKNKFRQMWVIPVQLRAFSDDLNNKTFSKDVKTSVKNIIAKAAGVNSASSKLSEKLFNHFYDVTGNIAVLLDGFDEITPPFYEKGIEILNTLQESLVSHIMVTTRPVWETRLQLATSTLCFYIRPLSERAQKKFIENYCLQKNMSEKTTDLLGYIDQVTKQMPGSIGKYPNKFIENPLHLEMIAEAYDSTEIIPLEINGLQLFEKLVDKKIENVLDEKIENAHTNSVLKSLQPDWLEIWKKHLMDLALLTILPQKKTCSKLNPSISRDKYEELKEYVEKGKEKTGIVSSFKLKSPQFIHKSYAEYFVAHFFARHFTTNRDFLESKKMFFSKSFNSVREFFDRILAIDMELHESVLQRTMSNIEDIKEVNGQDPRGGRTALHVAAAQSNSEEEIDILLSAGANANIRDNVLQWKPVDYAIRLKHFANIGPLLEVSPPTSNVNDIVPTTWASLRMAISGDYKELLLHLIKNNIIPMVSEAGTEYLFNKKWINGNSKGQKLTLLHVAAWHNASKILKYFLNADNMDYKSQIECHDDKHRTPLLLAICNRSLEAAMVLVEARANLLETTEDKKNTVRLAMELHDEEMLAYILMAMKSQKLEIVTQIKETVSVLIGDKSSWALLMLKYLLDTFPELKETDKGVPLITAASIKGNEDAVAVISKEAEVNVLHRDWTPIHYAAHGGHIEVVKVLLQCPGINTNIVDNKGNTPCDLAKAKEYAPIVDLLNEHMRNTL